MTLATTGKKTLAIDTAEGPVSARDALNRAA